MVHNIMPKKRYEKVDDKPVAVPVKFRKPVGEVDRMRSLMAQLVVELKDNKEIESFEDSLDFELEDEGDDLPFGISQSEMRYMKEERLLTEKEEADRVLMQRRAAENWRAKYGKGERGTVAGGKGGAEGGDGGVSEKRGAGSEQAGTKSGGESGVRGAGEGSSESVRKAG